MPVEEFRRHAHQLVDWIAEHFAHIDQVPVLPAVRPGGIRANLAATPPSKGEPMERILSDVNRVIMPGMTHWNHPDFFAYFSISGSGPGILGELLSAALNVNGMVWKSCLPPPSWNKCLLTGCGKCWACLPVSGESFTTPLRSVRCMPLRPPASR